MNSFVSKSFLKNGRKGDLFTEKRESWVSYLLEYLASPSLEPCPKPKPKHDPLNSHVLLRGDYIPPYTMDVCHSLTKCQAEKQPLGLPDTLQLLARSCYCRIHCYDYQTSEIRSIWVVIPGLCSENSGCTLTLTRTVQNVGTAACRK